MHDPDALESFIGKWRARWPEWQVAEVFVPRTQRELALVWAALQQELTDAAWGGGDPRPGEAKLGWWQEELGGWTRGVRRHPLGSVLQRQSAPWARLAGSLPALAGTRERARDADEAFAQLQAFASVVAAIDAALFASAEPAHGRHTALISAMLLQARLLQSGDTHVPLAVVARAAGGDARALWAVELRRRWPGAADAPRVRRLWAAIARARLEHGDAVRPLSPWTALRLVWRAARS